MEDRVGSKIIDPKAIDFVASKVAATSGDARKVLEITSNAVAKCLESLSSEERNDTKLEKPIVSLKFMLKAVKGYNPKGCRFDRSNCRRWGKLSSVSPSR